MTDTAKPFAVNLYGSHPDLDNDDCWTGDEFATLDQARDTYDRWSEVFSKGSVSSTTHVELTGPGVYEVKQVVSDKVIAARKQDLERSDREWQREVALEAGMLGGCDAYHEAMGWD